MGKRITIKEIAKEANVSIGTVDRVLHNRGRVSKATREKVLAIAKAGNYSSNILARHLKLNKTYKIQVILPNQNNYSLMLKEGIDSGCLEYEGMGFSAQYFFQNEHSENPTSSLEKLIASDVDAFIIAPSFFHQHINLLERLVEYKKPFVFIDSRIKASKYLSYVGQNAFMSGMLAARLLYEKYLESYEIFIVTFMKSALNEPTVVNRIEGFKNFFQSKPIKNVSIHEINFERDTLTATSFGEMLLKKKLPVHLLVPNSKSYFLADILPKLAEKVEMRVIGYDLLPANLDLLNKEYIDYLIHQKPQSQGYLAVQTIYKYLVLNKDIIQDQFMPLDIITKENLMFSQ